MEALEQSMRFTILGSWDDIDPDATSQLQRIYRQCKLLFAPLMAYETDDASMVEVNEEDPDPITFSTQNTGTVIVCDAKHRSPAISHRSLARTIKAIGLPVNESDLNEERHATFYAELRQAYRREYNKSFMVFHHGKRAIKWWKKVSFTCVR